jgi:hypothetical protein
MPDLGQTTFCYTMYHDLIELPAKHFDRNGGTLSGGWNRMSSWE